MRYADALLRCVSTVNKELTLTGDIIQMEQVKDELCNQFKQQEGFWVDEEDVLYRQNSKDEPLIVIPTSLVPTVLKKNYYELPFTAYQGVERTSEFIKRKYWWETLVTDVRKYIRKCDACARRKTGNRVSAPLGDQLEAKEFLDVVSLDIVGPLPATERGNKYILTFVDHFTRFCEAVPIVRQDTEAIARGIVTRIITQLGVPKKVVNR